MAGLVPAIHVFVPCKFKGVDGRDEHGHDESSIVRLGIIRRAYAPIPGKNISSGVTARSASPCSCT